MSARAMIKSFCVARLQDAAGTQMPRSQMKALIGSGAERRPAPPLLRSQRDGLFRRDILD
jgi:hypothetical protein